VSRADDESLLSRGGLSYYNYIYEKIICVLGTNLNPKLISC